MRKKIIRLVKDNRWILISAIAGIIVLARSVYAAVDRDEIAGLVDNYAAEFVGLAFGFVIVYGIVDNRRRALDNAAEQALRRRLSTLRNIASNAMADYIGPPIVREISDSSMVTIDDVKKNFDLFASLVGKGNHDEKGRDWRRKKLDKIHRAFGQTKWKYDQFTTLYMSTVNELYSYLRIDSNSTCR